MEPWNINDSTQEKLWDTSNCSVILNEESSENDNNFEEDMDWLIICQVIARSILTYYEKYIHKVPCRISSRTGHRFMEEILNGHEMRCYQAFRLSQPVFMDFCHELIQRYDLRPTRGMSVYEEVGIFLLICAHGVDNRLSQEIFNHSGETISRHFHRILKVVGKLANDIIAPHPEYNDSKGYHKPQHQRYMPFFKVSGLFFSKINYYKYTCTRLSAKVTQRNYLSLLFTGLYWSH